MSVSCFNERIIELVLDDGKIWLKTDYKDYLMWKLMREEFKVCTIQGILSINITTNHNFYHLGRHHDIEIIIENYGLIMTIQFIRFILTTVDFMLIFRLYF